MGSTGSSTDRPDQQDRSIDCVRISSSSSRVRVIGEDRTDVHVDGKATVEHEHGVTTIDDVHSSIEVRVPSGTCVVVGTTSARVDIEGSVGDSSIVSTSGKVSVERAHSLDVRTDSSRVDIHEIDGPCTVRSNSGRVTIDACHDVEVSTTSGRIELGGVSGEVDAHCTSGKIDVTMTEAADVRAETVSGKISIALPKGTRVHRAEHPGDSTETPEGADCTVSARSVSGRVTVQ